MFTTELNGKEHKVFFKHTKQANHHPTGTTCLILDKDTNAELNRAVAKCNPTDRFEYETGRRLALTRALEQLGLTRDQRRGVWAAYHAMSAQPA